jgi:CDP-diacylglycerol---glycerol-3-phosphate 3-phosphatidyltransferase
MILPNQLTVLRIILTPVFFILFTAEDPLLKKISLLVYIIAAITDWYDGWLARKFNYITDWGKFLDPLADKILTSTAFAAFVLLGELELWMVLVIIFRDLFMTGLRLVADFKKKSFKTSIAAKIKTFVQMFFINYLILVHVLISDKNIYNYHPALFDALLNHDLLYYTMLSITLYTLLTGIFYIQKNYKIVMELFKNETPKR